MSAIVVPFRGSGAKLRLAPLADEVRAELARAMLGDVLAACRPVGATTVVTEDEEAAALARELGAAVVHDPGEGQGPAVAAAIAEVAGRPILVVNADVPAVVPRDLRTLAGAAGDAGLALVEADDGTTNALALSSPELFAPLYGPGSADRFAAHAASLGVPAMRLVIPRLAADVDTLADLQGLSLEAGPRTLTAIATLGLAA